MSNQSSMLGAAEACRLGEKFGLDEVGQGDLIDALGATAGRSPWPKAAVLGAIVEVRQRRLEEERRQALTRLLSLNQGRALGLELRHQAREMWVAIFPDASEPGRFRHQSFDTRCFFSHSTFDTEIEALKDAIDNGFLIHDPGSLDRLAATVSWSQGLAALEEVQRHNMPRHRRQAA